MRATVSPIDCISCSSQLESRAYHDDREYSRTRLRRRPETCSVTRFCKLALPARRCGLRRRGRSSCYAGKSVSCMAPPKYQVVDQLAMWPPIPCHFWVNKSRHLSSILETVSQSSPTTLPNTDTTDTLLLPRSDHSVLSVTSLECPLVAHVAIFSCRLTDIEVGDTITRVSPSICAPCHRQGCTTI
ncbi:uncharacterized protein BCR38DRAFT_182174 [Pseudomassariella vexata]|uniref:Uncharacterized protein n=1 Tax=Pseudomassariella vexata TaxID=1141098 RepID=A0A1Y2E4M6_9PEZI|nr:uncharacterized protein BCR38DRAFT_182174 [Pseudomassariella vexata]ORY66510.1 hypothetical protein BCR38DRAFT_182174 [Pseudomassariella vexata]